MELGASLWKLGQRDRLSSDSIRGKGSRGDPESYFQVSSTYLKKN